MNTLDLKVFRELWMIRGQILAIAIIIACGLSTVIMSYTTLGSLHQTRERYYQEYGFADVFASLKRAPESLVDRIRQIPGVDSVSHRVLAPARIYLEHFDEPIQGQLVSYDETQLYSSSSINRIFLKEGRLPLLTGSQTKEVLISEAFAQPHDLHPGDQLSIIVNGKKQKLTISGIGLSPEFIYQIAPGAMIPDFERYGIIWMDRKSLETAYDMQGSFNDLNIRLQQGSDQQLVIELLDEILKPYGGLGTYDRDLQVSHHFLSEEFKQLDAMGSSFSIIFLAVSIFLLNMVVGRIIASQREIIASLKAFGLSNTAIALHYGKMIFFIVLLGIVAGNVIGLFLGKSMADLYMEYYRFPYLDYRLQINVIVVSNVITLVTALLGTWFSIRKAVSLQPAEAMRPETPAIYHETMLERTGLKDWFSQPTRMILRHLERHPVKSTLSVLGTAIACSIMIVGTFFMDAMDLMVDTDFKLSHREDLMVTFTDPTSFRAIYELRNMQGVSRVEPFRSVAVEMRNASHAHRTAIQGLSGNNQLHRVLDDNQQAVQIPDTGILLTEYLARKLNVKVGDWLTLEFLEGKRLTRQVAVNGVSRQYIGLSGYMNINALNNLMQEDSVVSGAYLSVDNEHVQSELKRLPQIAAVTDKQSTIDSFYDTVGELILTYISFIALISMATAFGVIYNNARITLAERSRELASLRVLGFTNAEIAYILLGELALITLIAIPVGMFSGYWMSYGFIIGLQQDLFRIPLVISSSTYAMAVMTVVISAVLSAFIVQRKLAQLDLIGVLKVKE